MQQLIEHFMTLEVRRATGDVHEPTGIEAALFIVSDADTPAATGNRLMAAAASGLPGRRTLRAIDARIATARKTRVGSAFESFTIGKVGRLLAECFKKGLRALVRAACGMKPRRHLPFAKEIGEALAEADFAARDEAAAATALRSPARGWLKDVRHLGRISACSDVVPHLWRAACEPAGQPNSSTGAAGTHAAAGGSPGLRV